MNVKVAIPKVVPETALRRIDSFLPLVNVRFLESCTLDSIAHAALLAEKLIETNVEKNDPRVLDALAMSLTVKDYEVTLAPN